ncbi:YafY family protein [Blastococcus sp. LR1]|uniref:helix-turn-helix transcriptional regulator n=1 Tax=Blastococcus sp. LR1 TaxID=2877000 RepID=UPI001CCE3454|nr:WYL domain-containing protein [Blastococcus sp. LR1]MCA0143901.1 WYL domain-containing protein [Blastococcus sp. LR1]
MTRTEHRTPAPLPPVDLTPEEAAAVVGALAARPDGPFAEAGHAALEKVLTALEPDPGRRSQMLASSRWVAADATRTAEVRRSVEQGLAERRVLVLDYCDGQNRWSQRAVEPQLLVRDGSAEFLVAWCREREALRWFRADRISEVQLTSEAAPRRELPGVDTPQASNHPAGRKLPRAPVAQPEAPRLRLLPGGLT